MGSVGDESPSAFVEATKEVIEDQKVREDASVELTKEPHLQKVEVCEDALVELIEEPHLQKAEVCEDALVELIEEPHIQKVEVCEDPSVELTEEPHLHKAEVCEDALVELTEEPHLHKAEVCEDALVDAIAGKLSTGMGVVSDEHDKVDNRTVTMGESRDIGDDADVQVVAPAPKRKLPSVKRFSARRSAGVDDGSTMDHGLVTNGDVVLDSTAPSTIRRQRGVQRFSARMGMGIDDRDTVDYGSVAADDPKPVETHAIEEAVVPTTTRKSLTYAEREQLRLQNIKRIKEIPCLERVRGRLVDITAGLELHTGVFSRVEQQKLVDLVRDLQAKGRRNELKERTYSEPRKWMRGKGRVTLQFGCCYNYAVDKNGNPPGILREDVVDPIPSLLRITIKRLVRWHVLPPTCVPDSCIINMYEEGDCIPPHIDHHDFLRPFCTLSLLSECKIVFGANLEILGPGDFDGKLSLPLPVGSVLVLNGNGADVAKHAVPAVPTERISITFRKMDPAKVPTGFTIDKELQNLKPVTLPSPQPADTVAGDS